MAVNINKIVGEGDEGATVFSKKFRTPRLPPLEELTLFKMWDAVLELTDFEAELLAKRNLQLYDVVDRKRAEKECVDLTLVSALRNELDLDSSQPAQGLTGRPKASRSKSSLRSKTDSVNSSASGRKKELEFRRACMTGTRDFHPDEILLRYLVQQQWDVGKAFARIVVAGIWRVRERKVNELLQWGEEGALITMEESTDKRERADAKGFIEQCKVGGTIVRGIDWEGRPIVITRMRMYRPHEMTGESMRVFIHWQIEHCRLMLGPSNPDAVGIWDFTGASTDNIPLATFKFTYDTFMKHMPGAYGMLFLHNCPKVFEKSWAAFKGLMKPNGATKIKFTYSVEELEQYIPRKNIIKELGGDDPWEFSYTPVQPGENEHMKDEETRDRQWSELEALWDEYDSLTRDIVKLIANGQDFADVKKRRHDLADYMRVAYWKLDPYIRARSYYDRQGTIGFRRESAFMAFKLSHGQQMDDLKARFSRINASQVSADTGRGLSSLTETGNDEEDEDDEDDEDD